MASIETKEKDEIEELEDEYRIDTLAQDVLMYLDMADGDATTPELDDMSDLPRGKIRYRLVEKLEPAGFVDLEQGDARPGKIEPTTAYLTDFGREYLERIGEYREDPDTITDRIEQLRADIDQVSSQIEGDDGTADRVDDLEARLDELEADFESLWDGMAAMRDYLREEHDADLKKYQ